MLRGGYGIYFNQGSLATSEGLYFNPPFFNLGVYFPFPGLPPLTVADPFPAFFPIPIPQSATAYQRDLETPWMEHYNINVQRQVGHTRSVEIAYVGSRGHDLISARDLNQAAAGRRPNPAFADITFIESRASSLYNALQLRYQQRPAVGATMLLSYTFGKSTDDASGFFAAGQREDSRRRHANRAGAGSTTGRWNDLSEGKRKLRSSAAGFFLQRPIPGAGGTSGQSS